MSLVFSSLTAIAFGALLFIWRSGESALAIAFCGFVFMSLFLTAISRISFENSAVEYDRKKLASRDK